MVVVIVVNANLNFQKFAKCCRYIQELCEKVFLTYFAVQFRFCVQHCCSKSNFEYRYLECGIECRTVKNFDTCAKLPILYELEQIILKVIMNHFSFLLALV